MMPGILQLLSFEGSQLNPEPTWYNFTTPPVLTWSEDDSFFSIRDRYIHMAKWKKRRYVWGERQSVKMRLTVEARISWGQQPIRKLLHTLPSENLSVFLFSPERKGKYEDCRTEKLHHGAEHQYENHSSTHHSAQSPSTDRAWPASDPWPSFCTNLSARDAEFSR